MSSELFDLSESDDNVESDIAEEWFDAIDDAESSFKRKLWPIPENDMSESEYFSGSEISYRNSATEAEWTLDQKFSADKDTATELSQKCNVSMCPSERCGEELQPSIAQCPLEAKNPSDSKKVSESTVVAFKAHSGEKPSIAQCPLEAKNPSDSKKVSDNTVVALKAHSDKKMNELMATKLSNRCNVGNDCVMRSFWSADLPHFGFSAEDEQLSENHGTSSHELIPSFLNETGAKSPFPICKIRRKSGECQESHAKDDRESLHESTSFRGM